MSSAAIAKYKALCQAQREVAEAALRLANLYQTFDATIVTEETHSERKAKEEQARREPSPRKRPSTPPKSVRKAASERVPVSRDAPLPAGAPPKELLKQGVRVLYNGKEYTFFRAWRETGNQDAMLRDEKGESVRAPMAALTLVPGEAEKVQAKAASQRIARHKPADEPANKEPPSRETVRTVYQAILALKPSEAQPLPVAKIAEKCGLPIGALDVLKANLQLVADGLINVNGTGYVTSVKDVRPDVPAKAAEELQKLDDDGDGWA